MLPKSGKVEKMHKKKWASRGAKHCLFPTFPSPGPCRLRDSRVIW